MRSSLLANLAWFRSNANDRCSFNEDNRSEEFPSTTITAFQTARLHTAYPWRACLESRAASHRPLRRHKLSRIACARDTLSTCADDRSAHRRVTAPRAHSIAEGRCRLTTCKCLEADGSLPVQLTFDRSYHHESCHIPKQERLRDLPIPT